jgi:hypothetical protein
MRIDVDSSCFLETSSYTSSGDKLKIVVLLSRVERNKILGEIVNSQLGGRGNSDSRNSPPGRRLNTNYIIYPAI